MFRTVLAGIALAAFSLGAQAQTIRIAIGTQDTTINCAAGGLLVRELGLLQKYLPHDGQYQGATYDIQWKNFTSGAPLTNEMVAGKLDFGAMADFPGALNGVAHEAGGRHSLFINVLSGSVHGSGNGIVVPKDSPVQSLAELKGQVISVPFASTAHGMLLRAVAAQGWDPARDVTIIAQPPEVAGSALQAGKVAAHADFVPFAELFESKGFARKIYDGSQADAPTFHGALVEEAFAQQYPELVVAYLRATLEANQLLAAHPEQYSELIEKVTGIDASVAYLYHGPLGLQTRDLTWKPEYRQAVATAIDTLKLLKKADRGLDTAHFIDDRYIRQAFQAQGLDYAAALANYAPQPLTAKDALTGQPLNDLHQVAQVWVQGEAQVRSYANPQEAFAEVAKLQAAGKAIRAVYAQASDSGIKLLASQAWYVRGQGGSLQAFLLKGQASAYAQAQGGTVAGYAEVSAAAVAAR